MSEIKIEKGVDIPVVGSKPERCIYPLAEMKVGDSFQVPKGKMSAIKSSAGYWGPRLSMKFTVRKHEGGYRCWRIK